MQTPPTETTLTRPDFNQAAASNAETPAVVGRVVELFAGVGGFRLALERCGWQVVLGNQWEPSTRVQHAFDCYSRRFEDSGSEDVNLDIAVLLDAVESHERGLPEFDLLVGGFPCQDYSVAKLLAQAHGIEGKKGVLWWQIHRLLEIARPKFVFLENVDRLLKSPATQRGRDFAIMLASMSDLGYAVEWRVVNAADYGFPQRRRRAFIVAEHEPRPDSSWGAGLSRLFKSGVLARALPVEPESNSSSAMTLGADEPDLVLQGDLVELTQDFGKNGVKTPFQSGGVMVDRWVWTRRLEPSYRGRKSVLGDVLVPESDVPEEFFVSEQQLDAWRYLKGAKREERRHNGSGATYFYSEGPLPFPDPIERPARTILTSEGGRSPSRFKHIIQTPSGRYRRLTPLELERLNGFPDGWTVEMSPAKRAFCMGNALVVGLVEKVGRVLATEMTGAVAEE